MAASCALCAAGYYQSQAQQRTCLNCGLGYFSSMTGQGKAASFLSKNPDRVWFCNCGHYVLITAACQACPPGQYASSVTNVSCSVCPVGSYQSQSGQSACVLCDLGSYSSVSGQTVCADCLPGLRYMHICLIYFVLVIFIHCGLCTHSGSFNNAPGQAQCSICSAGSFTSPQPGAQRFTCSNCSAGFYAPGIFRG